jgi:hypothetical protein
MLLRGCEGRKKSSVGHCEIFPRLKSDEFVVPPLKIKGRCSLFKDIHEWHAHRGTAEGGCAISGGEAGRRTNEGVGRAIRAITLFASAKTPTECQEI